MPRYLTIALLFAVLISAPRPTRAQDHTFERSFPVTGAAVLDATTDSGAITVRAGSGSSIEVRGRVQVRRGWNVPGNAAELASRLAAAPPLTQDGQTVRLGRIDDETTRRAVTISYEVTVPPATTVEARTGSGAVRVEGVQGAVRARTGSGSIGVRALGGNADLTTGSGAIEAGAVKGALAAATGSGSINASGIGAGLQATTGSGAIEASLDGKGDVAVKTGSGSVSLTGVVGALTASTGSGSIEVSGRPVSGWKASSASGRIAVRVPADSGFRLDARSSSGAIDVDMPLTTEGRQDRRHVQGSVRGGGPTLELSTASGSISVR